MVEKCRFCSSELTLTFCDLGKTPPANAYPKTRGQKEAYFPLHAFVCKSCLLVQLGEFQTPDEIFSHYFYFSSYSDSWVEHAKKYAEQSMRRFSLNPSHKVIEIASNDGYLLQHFRNAGIPILGIEPARNIAEFAQVKGIPTLVRFFGLKVAEELTALNQKADLLIANNVLAHVPQLNDFVAGLKCLLAPRGVLTLEFPHLLQLIQQNQFDTIYHEHFSYFSLLAAEAIFSRHELELFDVEELSTHGGSLRVYLQHVGGPHPSESRVAALREKESREGMKTLEAYGSFSTRVEAVKKKLLGFLEEAKRQGKIVAGYGAPAKGNTLLNYCRVTPDLLPFTVDRSPHKQGSYLPGTQIPIYAPTKVDEVKPDYLLILPWNLHKEITGQMAHIRNWGAKFVVPIPDLEIL